MGRFLVVVVDPVELACAIEVDVVDDVPRGGAKTPFELTDD